MANSKQKLGLEMVYIILVKHASFMYDKFQMNIFLKFFFSKNIDINSERKDNWYNAFFLFYLIVFSNR